MRKKDKKFLIKKVGSLVRGKTEDNVSEIKNGGSNC